MSIVQEKRNGRRLFRCMYRDPDGRRRGIRLRDVDKKGAEAIDRRVQSLNSCRISGQSLSPSLAEWVGGLGQELHDKLADAGLVERRRNVQLKAFLDQYVDSRSDLEEFTRINLTQTVKKLVAHFGADTDMRSITEGDCDNWRQTLADSLSLVSVGAHIKRSRQFFKVAQRQGLVDSNPFAEVRGGRQDNSERQRFIDRSTIETVLEHCPDAEWRLIIVLARYGGLRCPSEVMRLKWSDINWSQKRFVVTSNKTKKQGKPRRVVPLWPEVEAALLEAFEMASIGAEYVISRHRGDSPYLRKGFLRILNRAAVLPWPRLFTNLRSSRESELIRKHPLHVVTNWLGNSPKTAVVHYLQVTEDDFQSAVEDFSCAHAGGGAPGGSVASGTQLESPGTYPQNGRSEPEMCLDPEKQRLSQNSMQECSGTDCSPRKTHQTENGGRTGGARLNQLIQVWPDLDETTQNEILHLAGIFQPV